MFCFYIWISDWFSTIFWKDYTFFIELVQHFCKKNQLTLNMSLFPDSVTFFIDLQRYRSTINFCLLICILQSCWSCLSVLIILVYKIFYWQNPAILQIDTALILPFLSRCLLFSCLSSLARIFVTMVNRSGQSRDICLYDIRGKSFNLSVLYMMLVWDFFKSGWESSLLTLNY